MSEKLRAHDYLTSETPRPRRSWRRPWYERLLLAVIRFPGALRWWWSGPAGIGLSGEITTYMSGRRAAWQVMRLPLALLLFLYVTCCLIAGRMVSLGIFRAFLSHIFGWQIDGGL